MRKGLVILLGVFLSLIVPIVHLSIIKIATTRMNAEPNSQIDNSRELIHIAGVEPFYSHQTEVVYWYSYTTVDFMKDFIINMIVYLIVVFLFQQIRKKVMY